MATFYTGNTGSSTGPHLDFRVWDPRKSGWIDPRQFTGILRSGGKGISQFPVTSGYGMRNHPTKGGQRMHHGIDYGTETGTAITIPGARHLTTWDDKGGGGITSQYEFTHDGNKYEAFLMHGSDKNPILSKAAVSDGVSLSGSNTPNPFRNSANGLYTGPESSNTAEPAPAARTEAIDRVQNYANMSKAELNAAYDKMRSNPALADIEGMKMHKAFFGK